MSAQPVPAPSASASTRPESGPAALLRAIGLSAIQVAPGVVALQTTPKKQAA